MRSAFVNTGSNTCAGRIQNHWQGETTADLGEPHTRGSRHLSQGSSLCPLHGRTRHYEHMMQCDAPLSHAGATGAS